MKSYAIWNNKGGVGKTYLTKELAMEYAKRNPDETVVMIDLCPQANLTDDLVGGVFRDIQHMNNKTIGKYIQDRISKPDSLDTYAFNPMGKISNYKLMESITKIDHSWIKDKNYPDNVYLIAGDESLNELLCSVYQTSMIPLPPNRFSNVYNWITDLRDLIARERNNHVTFFIDCNTALNAYTMMALKASPVLIIPINSKFPDRRGKEGVSSAEFTLDHIYDKKGKVVNFKPLVAMNVYMDDFDVTTFKFPDFDKELV